MSYKYKVGHDAEFFLQTAIPGTIPAVVPACGLIGGTKEKPLLLENSSYGTTVQEDGVALELGMTPINCWDFINTANNSMREARQWVYNKTTLDLNYASTHAFSKEELAPHKQAFVMGCLPDRDAYERGVPRTPFELEMFGTRRFTGGHVHFSYECDGTGINHHTKSGTPTWAVVQMLDALALFFWYYYGVDYQQNRAKFYGLPGLYRNKPYGVEYRSPTNDFITGDVSINNGFIARCATIVQACAELPMEAVRGYYDRIPWGDVRRLMNLEEFPNHTARKKDSSGVYPLLSGIYRDLSRQLGEPQ